MKGNAAHSEHNVAMLVWLLFKINESKMPHISYTYDNIVHRVATVMHC